MLTVPITDPEGFLEEFLVNDKVYLVAVTAQEKSPALIYFLIDHSNKNNKKAFLLEKYQKNFTSTKNGIVSGFVPYSQSINNDPFFMYHNNILYEYFSHEYVGVRMSNGYLENLFLYNSFYEIKATKNLIDYLFRPEFQKLKEGTVYRD